MKRRLLSLFIILSLVSSFIAIPASVFAAGDNDITNITLTKNASSTSETYNYDVSFEWLQVANDHYMIFVTQNFVDNSGEDLSQDTAVKNYIDNNGGDAADPSDDSNKPIYIYYKAEGDGHEINATAFNFSVPASIFQPDGMKIYLYYSTANETTPAGVTFDIDASGNLARSPMTAPTVSIAPAGSDQGGVKATITPSGDKNMVDHYVVNLYAEGADPKTATPVATSVNIVPAENTDASGNVVWTLPINPLTRPNYKHGSKVIATVTAVAKDGAAKGDATSAASPAAADPDLKKFVKPEISQVVAATTSATLTTTSPVAPGSAGYYDIKYTLDGGASTTLAGNKTITGLTAGNNYSVKIQFAPNTQGNAYYIASDESDPKTFTTDNYAFTVDAASKAMTAVDYGTAPTAVTFTITNTGNKQLTFDTANKANTDGFSANIAPQIVAAGGKATLTVSANEGLNAGTYAPVFTINGKNGSNTAAPADVTVNLTVNKKPVIISAKTGLAKYYGQEKNLTLADCDITGATAAQLNGVTVTSTGSGVDANASDAAYPITIDAPAASNPNYAITITGTNGLKVNKATLDAAITAGNIRDGQKVGDSVLSGSFTNHYNTNKKVQTTEGTLEWTDKDTVLHATDNDAARTKGWTFTVTGANAGNYEPVTGTAKITVSELTQPTITAADKTVPYNGSAQAINTPTANSGGAVTVTYEQNGTAVTNPTNAGTYTAIINVAANGAYAAGTDRKTLTITPREITLNDANLTIANKVYDKTTTAAIAAGSVLAIANKVGSDDVAIDLAAAATSVTFADADVGDGKNVTVTITPSANALTGNATAIGNYELKAATITKQANITARPITIDIRDITKQYGVEHTFNGQGWQIAETQPTDGGLVGNDSRDSLGFKLASIGAAADKDAGKYAVTWTKTNNNYAVTVNPTDLSQKFTVTPVTPIEATAVTAGGVKQNAALSNSKLNGTFKHPTTNAPVPGTLTWDNGTKPMSTLGDATEAWTFTPDNTTNYAIVKGNATVTVADKDGAGLTVQSRTVTYDGTVKAIEAPTADSDGRITITYTKDGVVVAEPINAGTYTVEVVIDATEAYQGETANVELIIEPAKPAGSATASAIEKGDKLNQSALTPNFTDKDGNKLDGDIEWTPVIGQTPDIIEPDGKTEYTYTFTSKDGNYKIVAKTLVPINSTEREPVVTKIINIPNTANPDYLYLNVANLKAGETVAFYGNSALTGSKLGEVEITDEIKAAGNDVKVTLTGLNAKGGTLYAAIDGTGRKAYAYDAQADFTFNSTSVSVKKDSSKSVSIRPTGTVSNATWTVASSSIATLSNGSNTGVTVNGAAKGSTKVTAVVTFEHPDEIEKNAGKTVSVEKTFNVTVTTSTATTPSGNGGGTSVVVSRAIDHISYLNGYPDGSFMPDNAITRAEAAAIFARIDGIDLNKSYTMNFTDTDANAWYAPYVGYMQQTGILQGYPEGNFNPGAAITRAEFATLVAKYKNLRNKQGASFTDVAAEYWAAGYIAAVQESGWVVGYNDGTFRPTSNITRAEVVQIVNSMLDRQIDAESLRNAEYKVFNDVTTSHWAYYQIIEASNKHSCTKENGKEIWKK